MNLSELTKAYDFTGKTVVITGGAGILGGEIACALVGCNAIGFTPTRQTLRTRFPSPDGLCLPSEVGCRRDDRRGYDVWGRDGWL